MRIVELRESCILTTTARLSWRSVCRSSLHRGVLGRTLPAVLRQLDSYSYALSTSHSSQRRAVPDSAATGAATGYMTLEKAFRYEAEVKKSRFVVTAWPIASTSQAMQLVQQARNPDASHNCFAYRLGQQYRSSDDGEPGGTAGRPILTAIEGEGLDGVCVLVTRYYGGVKLGAGGLVRAYGGSARDCLKLCTRVFVQRKVKMVIQTSFDQLGAVYNCLDKCKAEREAEEYTASGDIEISVQVAADIWEQLQQAVGNATNGRVIPQVVEESEDE